MHWLRVVAVWLIVMGVETMHGILREVFVAPYLGDFRARQITVLTGSLLIVAVVTLFIHWLRLPTIRSMLAVGMVWVLLTMSLRNAWCEGIFGMFDSTFGDNNGQIS